MIDSSLREKFMRFYEKYMLVVGVSGHTLFLFQAAKIFVNQSSRDVSLIGFLVALFSLASWLIYGILIKDRVLIYVNIAGVLAAGLCVCAILLFG